MFQFSGCIGRVFLFLTGIATLPSKYKFVYYFRILENVSKVIPPPLFICVVQLSKNFFLILPYTVNEASCVHEKIFKFHVIVAYIKVSIISNLSFFSIVYQFFSPSSFLIAVWNFWSKVGALMYYV